MKQKKVPLRMCVSCRTMFPKRDLIRVVRTEDEILLDATGKAAGRGAYICGQPACLEKARKSRALERALGGKGEEGLYDKIALVWDRRRANLDAPPKF